MSRLRVNKLTNKDNNGAPEFVHGVTISGVATATKFKGDGSELTSVPSNFNILDSGVPSGTISSLNFGNGISIDSTLNGVATISVDTSSLASLSGATFTGDVGAVNVKIGGTLPSTPNISLNADGSATFTSINPVVTDQPSTGNIANPAIQIKHDGTINGSWRHDGRFEVGGQDADAEITLSPNGSASFGGEINIGGYDSSSTTADGVLLGSVGGVYSQLADGNPAGVLFQGMHGSTFTSRITAAGSAMFANDITIDRATAPSDVKISGSDTHAVWLSDGKFILKYDGSASFDGTITAAGYSFSNLTEL